MFFKRFAVPQEGKLKESANEDPPQANEEGIEAVPCPVPDVQTQRDILPPEVAYSKTMVAISWALWAALAAFLLFMPNYVPYLNKHFATNTCTFPTWELMRTQNITCVNGADLTQLARDAGRLNRDGEPAVCGCGQGIFGEDICPLGFLDRPKMGGFTVSNYIGTPTASAAFVLFSVGPTAMAWIYGTGGTGTLNAVGMTEYWLVVLTRITLFLFQVLFNTFMMATGCVLYIPHIATSGLAVLFGGAHFLLVAIVGLVRGRRGPIVIVGVSLIAAIAFGIQFDLANQRFSKCNVLPGDDKPTAECAEVLKNPYATFYPEALAVLALLSIPASLHTYTAFVQPVP